MMQLISVVGPSGLSVISYYRQLFDDVDGKSNAGFNTTITDYWGRALSYQLVDPSDGGPGMKPSRSHMRLQRANT